MFLHDWLRQCRSMLSAGSATRVVSRQRPQRRHRREHSSRTLEHLEPRTLLAAAMSLAVGSPAQPVTEGNTGTTPMDFTVDRSGPTTPIITYSYTTQDGTGLQPATQPFDYTTLAGTGTVATTSTQTTHTVQLVTDLTDEPSETLEFVITGIIDVTGGPMSFHESPELYSPGTLIRSVATADFNRDGKLDIVSANASSSNVTVFLNTTFPSSTPVALNPAIPLTTASGPRFVATGDFNNDGLPDIAATSPGNGAVSVMLNTTTPGSSTITFSTRQDTPAGTQPTGIAVADINGDGKLDLLVTNNTTSQVSVLLNTTTIGSTVPTFSLPSAFGTGQAPYSVAAVDINADGKLDLAVSNFLDNTVSILLNNTAIGSAALSFAAKQDFSTGKQPERIAVGDMNGDGKLDLVFANSAVESNSVSVLLNQTTPGSSVVSLGANQETPVAQRPRSVGLADLNGDGRLDVVTSDYGSDTVSALVNTTLPGGTAVQFLPVTSGGAIGSPIDITLADLNGDYRPDAAIAAFTGNKLEILRNLSNVQASMPDFANTSATSGSTALAPIMHDFNGDGRPDVAVVDYASGQVVVRLDTTSFNSTTAAFSSAASFNVGTQPVALAAADLNGDGKLDLVVANRGSGNVSVLFNTTSPGAASPSFAAKTDVAAGTNPRAVALGDLNGDNLPDIAVANFGSNNMSILLNSTTRGSATPSFPSRVNFTTGTNPAGITLGDINSDGRLDVVVGNSGSGNISAFVNTTPLNTSTPTFAAKVDFTAGLGASTVALSDFNGDGKPDVAVANSGATTVSVLMNTTTPNSTTPSFTARTNFAISGNPTGLAIADMDYDYRPDLVVTTGGVLGSVSILSNNTNLGLLVPNFATPQAFTTGTTASGVALADLNGDRRLDMVTGSSTTGEITAMIAQAATIVQSTGIGIIQNDDFPDVNLSIFNSTIPENAGSTAITATLSAPTFTDLAIPLNFGGSANAPGTPPVDFNHLGATILIPQGSTTGQTIVFAINDSTDEPDETITVTFGTLKDVNAGPQSSVTTTIIDDDPLPLVTMTVDTFTILETGGVATITVTLTNKSSQDTVINFGYSGTASNGVDFTGTGSVTVTAMNLTNTATITGLPDILTDLNETIIVDITTVTNGQEFGTQQATVTITDVPPIIPFLTVSLSGSTMSENGGGVALLIDLSSPPVAPVTVDLGFTGTGIFGTDYSTSSTQVIIPAGTSTASLDILGIDDLTYEGAESIIVDVLNVVNAIESGTQQVTISIADDEFLPSVSLSFDSPQIPETGGVNTLTATLSNPSTAAVTVNLQVTGSAFLGIDYLPASLTSIVIPPGQTTGSIVLTALPDTLVENLESIVVDITTVLGGIEQGVQQAMSTIADDDTATVALSFTGPSTFSENGGRGTVTATLSGYAGVAVDINLNYTGTAFGGGVDYSTSGLFIRINAGQLSNSIVLTGVDDLLVEPDEAAVVSITSISSTQVTPFGGSQSVTATITSNDVPSVTLGLTGSPLAEAAGEATVTATLSDVHILPVTVNLGFSGTAVVGTDFSTTGTSIVIPAGQTTGSVVLTGIEDLLYEGDEPFTVDITAVTQGTEQGVQQVTGSVTDNDSPPSVRLSLNNSPASEGGSPASVIATLSQIAGTPVTVNLSYAGTAIQGTDYNPSSGSIVIPAGSLSASLMLNAVNDTVAEATETIIVDITTVTNATEFGTQTVTASLTDDDTPQVTLSTSASSINEPSGVVTVTANLSNTSVSNVSVSLGLSGTARNALDYTVSGPLTLTIPAGSTSGSIVISTVNDTSVEGYETIIIDVTAATNAVESGTQQATITINDDETPFVTLGITGGTMTEGGTRATVTATLANTTIVPVTVNLAFGGTALRSTDYTPSATSIVIPAGQLSGSMTLTSYSDLIVESPETITVDITTVTAGIESGLQQVTATLQDGILAAQYDFDSSSLATEPGYLSVRGSHVYTAARGFGWNKTTMEFDRGAITNDATNSNRLRDGQYGNSGTTNARTFQADVPNGTYAVTITIGDTKFKRDYLQLRNADLPSSNPSSILVTGLAIPLGQFYVSTFYVPVTDGSLNIEFSDLGGDPYWNVNTMEIRSAQTTDIVVTTPVGTHLTDGATVDVFTVTAPLNTLVNVTSNMGTILGVGSIGGDASPRYQGYQLLGTGAPVNVYLRRPGGLGISAITSRSSTIIAEDVTGAHTGTGSIDYALPSIRRYDFNFTTNLTAVDSFNPFVGVRASNLFTLDNGYGWNKKVLESQDKALIAISSPYTVSTLDLYRDAHYGRGGVSAATFSIQVDPAKNYFVRLYIGDKDYLRDNVRIQAEGNTTNPDYTFSFGRLSPNTYLTPVLGGTTGLSVSADGILDLKFDDFGGDPFWRINGMDIWEATVTDPGAEPITAVSTQPGPAVSEQLTQAQLAPLVDEALRRWAAVGLSEYQLNLLRQTQFQIVDLGSSSSLALSSPGLIRIDNNGGGRGWFIDGTPGSDEEFGLVTGRYERRATAGSAAGRYDLLTVVMHELGHRLGIADQNPLSHPGQLMAGEVDVGTRRLPDLKTASIFTSALDSVFASSVAR